MNIEDFEVKKEYMVESNVLLMVVTPKYIIMYDELK